MFKIKLAEQLLIKSIIYCVSCTVFLPEVLKTALNNDVYVSASYWVACMVSYLSLL